jgi:acyl dehydratase
MGPSQAGQRMERMRELKFSEGDVFETPSKTITDAHALFFSALSGDNHPIHYDVEYARQRPAGRPLMHGLMLASFTAAGASAMSPLMDGFIFVEQGCKFRNPVFVGDTIYPRVEVEKIWTDRDRDFVRLATSIRNQKEEVVLEGFHVYLVR